jgi:hypothetical protein
MTAPVKRNHATLSLTEINKQRAQLNQTSYHKGVQETHPGLAAPELAPLTEFLPEPDEDRNLPAVYAVRWRLTDGQTVTSSFSATSARRSLEDAHNHAARIAKDPTVSDIQVIRTGRTTSTRSWLDRNRIGRDRVTRIRNKTGELVTQDEAWILPEGYVDPEADRHGPPVTDLPTNYARKRTNAEKLDWARNNPTTIDYVWHNL